MCECGHILGEHLPHGACEAPGCSCPGFERAVLYVVEEDDG